MQDLRTQTIKKLAADGLTRIRDPRETVATAKKFLPIMGITRIANVTHLDSIGIPVVMVVRPNSRSIAVAQGKGITMDAARASGLMESIETYHAETMLHPLKLASYEELRYTHNVVNVWDLPLTKNSRFHPDHRLLWIEGYDLLQEESIWLPYELVHTDYRLPAPSGSGCFAPTSNGLASGNHLLEAVIHGISEIVERDATSLHNFSSPEQQQLRRIDLATIDDPLCCDILQKFDEAGLLVAVWEMTSDITLPTFICSIVEKESSSLRPMFPASGMGTHLTRQIALLRAMTEAAQGRLTVISGARDDVFRNNYTHYTKAEVNQQFRDKILRTTPTRRFQDCPDAQFETLNEDLQYQLDALQKVGIERVIAIDLTNPFFNIPVARVVIPGLEGISEVDYYVPGKRVQALLKERKQEQEPA